MNITVNEELKAYIDPLTPDEHAALERSILAEGCRDALVLWGDVLVDGHNRYGICQKHGLPAVASLPAEEQKSAALAGKDELKQVAKRVRDIGRNPAQEDATTASVDEVQRLNERVAALSAENQELRAQVAELQARLIG